ncbi:hypothetical protein [Bradyrhizobium sp. LM2.9]
MNEIDASLRGRRAVGRPRQLGSLELSGRDTRDMNVRLGRGEILTAFYHQIGCHKSKSKLSHQRGAGAEVVQQADELQLIAGSWIEPKFDHVISLAEVRKGQIFAILDALGPPDAPIRPMITWPEIRGARREIGCELFGRGQRSPLEVKRE